jgi:hypothetical protein
MVLGAAFSVIALMALGCSLVGRVVDQAVDEATGGAVSTIESLQSEMGEALTTLPAEIPGELPGALPGATDGPPILDLGAAITGNLSYPSEGIPPLRVVAFDIETQEPVASVETQADQSTYSLPVPIGVYNVVAYTLDGRLAGGYTMAVLCGLSAECTDHSLIPVPAANGIAMGDIDPADWYAPEGSFPPMP